MSRLTGMLYSLRNWLPALALIGALLVISAPAQAAPTPPVVSVGQCTNHSDFTVPYSVITPGAGLISTIVRDVTNVLQGIAVWNLFTGLLLNPQVSGLAAIAVTLYILTYGVLFTFGMVQVTVYDFFIRMLKIGLIYAVLFAPANYWYRIYEYLWNFFHDGTNAIISASTQIAVGGIGYAYSSDNPFAILDEVIAKALSAEMAVTLMAAFFTGPYGIFFGILLLLSLGSFLKAMLTAIWVYLMALVVRTLLIGLFPIFICFILFNRTRHLFDGWLNQLVNASLQPIFLFVFFAFFVTLIQASMESILKTPVCWVTVYDSVRGAATPMSFWRFNVETSPGVYEPYAGSWGWEGSQLPDSPPFPIDILHILIFLMLAELAGRFNSVVIMLASDIAGASTNLATMQGPMSQWFSPDSGSSRSLGGVGTGGRTGPPTSGGSASLGQAIESQGMTGGVKSVASQAFERGAQLAGNRPQPPT